MGIQSKAALSSLLSPSSPNQGERNLGKAQGTVPAPLLPVLVRSFLHSASKLKMTGKAPDPTPDQAVPSLGKRQRVEVAAPARVKLGKAPHWFPRPRTLV